MKALLVIGTGRAERNTPRVAKFLEKYLEGKEWLTKTADVIDYPTTVTTINRDDEKTIDWKERVDWSDVMFLLMPEYNHGYPGELKLLLDRLYEEYKGKKVVLCGITAGDLGGARVVEHIIPVLQAFQVDIAHNRLYVSRLHKILSEDGDLLEPGLDGRVDKIIEELS
jgi:NAD(P)H-dependent FMN reductase